MPLRDIPASIPLNFHVDQHNHDANGWNNAKGMGVATEIYDMADKERNKTGAYAISEFGEDGGQAASKYARSVKSFLHHEMEYAPVKMMTAEEYEKQK